MPTNPFSKDEETGEYKNQGRFANAMRGFRDGGIIGAVGGAVEKPKEGGRLFGQQQWNKYGLGNYASRLDGGVQPLEGFEQPKFQTGLDKAAKVMKLFGGGI